jgi:hypothetical protein
MTVTDIKYIGSMFQIASLCKAFDEGRKNISSTTRVLLHQYKMVCVEMLTKPVDNQMKID